MATKQKEIKSRNWHLVNAWEKQHRVGGGMPNKKAYRRRPKHQGRDF